MSMVERIEQRPTVSGSIPLWDAAVLDCGHVVSGAREQWSHELGVFVDGPVVGDEVECPECQSLKRDRAKLPDLVAVSHHTRSGRGSSVFCYKLDSTSPTGVQLCGEFSKVLYQEFVTLARDAGKAFLSPLSPTERA